MTATTLRQFSTITLAILAMAGRVTMLRISRWAGAGGSYRTVQRFFYTVIPWAGVFWLFFRQHVYRPDDRYILAGDQTYGLDRFFSGLLKKVVPGLAFFAFSLVSLQERRAFPVRVDQVVRIEAEKSAASAPAVAPRPTPPTQARKPGRPKGGKNKDKTQVSLTPELQRIETALTELLALIGGCLPLLYLALDGHFGNHNALQMVRKCGLHLISKLRADAALYFAYTGPYAGRGPHRKYGDKIAYRQIPDAYLKKQFVEKEIETRIYQATMRYKEFAQPLNVVVIVKTNLHTQAWAHVVLFSSDLTLAYDQLIDYYSLRFQIEFNFRDAKQFWGLEDFMNTSATAVTNAANLSLFMVNLTHVVLRDFRQHSAQFGVLDLKAYCRGYKYVTETIKLLPQKPDDISMTNILRRVAELGGIHTTLSPASG